MEGRTYSFKEVSSQTNVKPYVLRFWETEFPEINPSEDQYGEKFYTDQDILAVEKIKVLLFEEKLSIPEAKVKFYEVPLTNDANPNERAEPVFLSKEKSPLYTLKKVQNHLHQVKERMGWS